MTDLEEITTSTWDLSTCHCAESQIERSCEPAEYAGLLLTALGVFVVATGLAWWGW